MFVNDSWSPATQILRGSLHSYNTNPEGQSSQRSSVSRPSGRAIYMQRKEYAESVCKQPNNLQYRVEHLLTADLDGKELRGLDDCVTKLRGLEAQARVWEQDMMLEVQGGHLLLSDIETKEELEALPLASVSQVRAVLDSCGYNSLLLLAVQERGRPARVFMFQCEEMGAENIRDNLERVVQHRKEEATENLRRNQYSIRSNLENIIGQESRGRFQNLGPPQKQPDRNITSPDHPLPHWNHPDDQYSGLRSAPAFFRDESRRRPEETPPLPQTHVKRDVEIFNHIVDDLEHFKAKLSAAPTPKKKGKKGDKNQKAMPPPSEFVLCLQKFKYGFNLMGRVNGQISNPSAEDFVHILFLSLHFVVSHCPPDLPPSVISPLPTEAALRLMTQVVTPEENKLWQSLGDAWKIPRSRWPNGDMVPPYKPVFYDGWEPPVTSNQPISRSNSEQYQKERPSQFLAVQSSGPWDAPPSQGPAPYMRVTYDFMSRNPQELSVMKGDLVQVLDQSKQWWKVRNNLKKEGYVPPNLLEPQEQDRFPEQPQGLRSAPPLNMMSQPEDVRAWLEFKGFSKITVRSLGVLRGAQVLALTREELKTVCPEEGARVFFHLQGVKSALALESESGRDPYRRLYMHSSRQEQ
ncbi:epidermal growth factor receptor kinase substrate 8-like protein 3b [Brienomyrus brachyistius]|uniref:epidermal growth factor receptor kinase substrate 8-like protein 3b n=1 Tax=Brienomyrus brachyistius TaxID=42636 RepID=UPI0020B38046|nr:epidermal growth factor receptor kinase substrate 8-like protein 3b [Brienomyrus brachyistius]XP_048859026.1 epidermal growth factor receptor kinase substrate 8-like protein 3b [Brienomyrus brachyistius]XP_048859027.1 epidermal growth factor receptor kinase substrate 8-like protein 3b [Brienomyrus brachyistius]